MISQLQYEDHGQERLFDKPRIIMHSKKMLLNLRRNRIHVDDIVDQINTHGVPMTRARFEDLFTSRPQRVVIATPAVFLVFVTVCYAFDASVLSAVELLDFADAARLPLRYYDQLSVHFHTQEWQQAWFGMLPTTKTYINRHLLVHRDHEFKRALQAYSNEQHIIVSGPAGIGKTAFAHALLLELEMLTGIKIAALYLDEPIYSQKELIAGIAQALNIRPLHNEPLELRMKSVLPTDRITYVFMDNVRCSTTDCAILTSVARIFPRMRFLLTTPHNTLSVDRLQALIGAVWVESLAPLLDTTTNSPAMMLFIQTLSTHGVTYASSDIHALHAICKSAHGIPREIMQLAQRQNMHEINPSRMNTREAMAKLNYHQLKVLSVLTCFQMPISSTFLTALLELFLPGIHPSDAIEALLSSHLIEQHVSDKPTLYRPTTEAVQLYTQLFTPLHLAAELAEHLDLLTRFVGGAEVAAISAMQRCDVHAIVALLKQCIVRSPNAVFDVAKLICAGLQLWLYHDVSSDIILIVEQILLQHSVDHPVIAELCVVTGRIYNTRGNYARSLQLLDMLTEQSSPEKHASIWARSLFVQLSAHISTQNNAAIAALNPHIIPAWHLIEANETVAWQNYVRIPLSFWHAGREDFPQALLVCNNPKRAGQPRSLTADSISLAFQHSLVHMMQGSYDIAKAILLQLLNTLEPFDVPYYVAAIKMRLAAIDALMHNLDDAVHHIVQSFDVLKCVGNVTELFFVADIYSLIQFRRQAYHSAHAISLLCAKLLAKYGMRRLGYIERVVNTKRAKYQRGYWNRWKLQTTTVPSTI